MASDPPSSSPVLYSVQIYTHNITRQPIAWDPTKQRPTQELIHAIHSALHFALDPCPSHPDETPSFCVTEVPTASESNKKEGRLIVPCVDDIVVTSEDAARNSKGEVTVKMFTGFEGRLPTVRDINEALVSVARATSVETVDKFILSLDRVKWQGDSEDDDAVEAVGISEPKAVASTWAKGMEDIENLESIWKDISARPTLRNLGVADFSPSHLSTLCSFATSSNPVCPTSAQHESKTLPHSRLPTINQLNFDTPLPESMISLASDHHISLVSHSDDLGTLAQIVGLLREFNDRLPLSAALKAPEIPDARDVFTLRWIVKYTIFLPERSLIANTGYILVGDFMST